MPKNLVIVESPAKARTIAKFLGSSFEVKSSFGHIRDLPKKDFGVDIKAGFKPQYVISPEKEQIVKELKSAAKASTVWLASDEDREGEAIAWHVCNVLDLKPDKTKRIVFHEITESAITKALAQPRSIDMKLVDAQQARRILDRLVGYELSPVLWKKVRAGLSAGRVQSVTVRLIVERERQIKDFKPEAAFKLTAVFDTKGKEVPAELDSKLGSEASAKKFLESASRATFTVSQVEQKPGSRSPAPPFTTSTLQQQAARRLGFSVKQTMTLAQRLYEEGQITYMRTDSTNLAASALEAAKKYVRQNFGQKYSLPRQYQTKSLGAQEAHEAIRPTNFSRSAAGRDNGQKKLYELIWRRAMASQMAPAQVEKTEVEINVSGHSQKFLAVGEVLKFDGFFKVYGGGRDDQILPPLKKGDKLKLKTMKALQTYSRPEPRYSEGTLVKKLEELGIGRPSTYAPTISTIQDREYVEKKDLPGEIKEIIELQLSGHKLERHSVPTTLGADRAKLVPTPLAEIVNDFLVKYFPHIVDFDFTAQAEKELDDIEEGKLTWQSMLERFYKNFHPLIEKSEKASRSEIVQARQLGKDPKSGKPVFARYGRFGPVLQMGETNKEKGDGGEKPKFAPLPPDTELDEVTLAQALPMFNLPRTVGETANGEAITADIGPYGPYIKVGKLAVSLKDADPLKVSEAEARKLIVQKRRAEAEKHIAQFGKIQVLRGPYGPYVTDGKVNARIPKRQDPEKLNVAAAKKLLVEAAAKKSKTRAKSQKYA